ncbi:receptor-like serine/threonine-protein kinase At4g25390 [Impatiens glandulifera]|uniref:receptor-like serine/threonine-protein kinase At4g25390 n=1 Tax=Impatiens glandulifera TaxID=253017 RepID=UPI001FB0B421|nr:receptor-like serine/threonine-protein kinase At4g25390 [Impatiens glandulifera]
MPSRRKLSSPSPSLQPEKDNRHVSPPIAGGASAAFSAFFLFFSICFRKLTSKRTVPSDSKLPHRFSYSVLRRATSNFLAANRLGRGGFGSVYRGTIGNPCQEIAVKVMDVGSLQGEREFQNELILAGKIDSIYIVSIIGFSTDKKRRRMLLVYEFMCNGSLQDCLLHRKSAELKEWKKRFSIALDIAKGLEYLHHHCQPPVIHGDIKPSNILLDGSFNAKIGDFGLARLRSEISIIEGIDAEKNIGGGGADDNESIMEETESKTSEMLPEEEEEEGVVNAVLSEGNINKSGSPKKSLSGKDWWWKQEKNESEVVKDYVIEWIGSEKPKSEWVRASSSSTPIGKSERKRGKKRLDWWVTMDDDKNMEKEKRRPAREWWREEYREELERKMKKKIKNKKQESESTSYDHVSEDGDVNNTDRKKRRNHDSLSCGISSTPSMRGTVCYTAPEYGGEGCDLSDKCDVYSFGVLLLVLIAGRRPLQVTSSPMSEFERFNLVSWARHLARVGKLLDLVDQSIIIESLNIKEAILCIKVALVCIQKSPAQRPSMKEVVGMFSGELESPQLPLESFSRFPHNKNRSQRKLVVR